MGSCLSAQVRFQATADAKQVLLNSYLEVTFTLYNADGQDFRPPPFQGARVVSGPMRSMRSTIMNGVGSTEVSYSYTLQPQQPGNLSIGSATVVANGVTMKSNGLQIEVIAPNTSGLNNVSEPIFARAVPDALSAYPGQQILLDYKIFTSVNVETYNLVEEPYYADSYAVPMRHFVSRSQREIIDGKEYTTGIVRRVALFPQRAGKLELGSLKLQAGVSKPNPGGRGTFFDRRMEYTFLETQKLELEIISLPEGAPASFSGAVGDFSMSATLSRQTLTTDDALSIRMIIRGDGDIKRVQVPDVGLSMDSFDLYEPRVLHENSQELSGRIYGEKTIEFLAIPKYPGRYQLAPAFSWFDPNSSVYRTSQAGPFNLEVRAGTGNRATPLPEETLVANELQYIRTDVRLKRPAALWFNQLWYWALMVLPFGLLSLAVLRKRQHTRRANINPALLRKQGATRLAEARLAEAAKHLKAGAGRAFYEELSKAFLGYVSDKLEVERANLNKNNVRDRLQQLQVPPSEVDEFIALLTAFDLAIFGRKEDPAQMGSHYERAVSVIASIEELQR